MNLSTREKSEVDLRVAQELKNHRDFIYSTNQSLQNINNAIVSLGIQNEKILTKFESDKTALKAAFESLNNDVIDHFKSCRSVIKDIADSQQKLGDVVSRQIAELKQSCAQTDVVSTCFDVLRECHDQLLNDFIKLKDYVTKNDMLVKGRIDELGKILREEIAANSKTVDPNYDVVAKKIDSMGVDFKGMQGEINRLKRAWYYEEKKFEFLNTKIDRLKEGENVTSR